MMAVPAPPGATLRVASYNVALHAAGAGELARELDAGSARADAVAAVLQRVRPDVVLLNEFDHDPAGAAATLFQRRCLGVAQPLGGAPLHYPYRYAAAVNTGAPSGLDLDGDGRSDGPGDAWGYGAYPGQYGMLLLSRYPLDAAAARSFRLLRWSALPDARRPHDPASGRPFHADAVWQQLRLSSKSHWDVPVRTPLGTVHLLASHPTPPAFDGPERRNLLRNADELRLWQAYLDDGDGRSPWLCDDDGRRGGLAADARFVLLGDLNNDPHDGAGDHTAIATLLAHPRLLPDALPRSVGGARAMAAYAEAGIVHRGDPGLVTCDFGPRVFALRLDYVLPSRGLRRLDGGVFWPAPDAADAALAEASDHRLVWADLALA